MEFVGLGFRSTDAASDAVKCDSMFIVQVAPCPQHTPGMHALTALTAPRPLCLCLCSYRLGTLRRVHLVTVPLVKIWLALAPPSVLLVLADTQGVCILYLCNKPPICPLSI